MSLNTEILSGCNYAVVSAVNGIYQGILIVLLVSLGLRVFGRTNAATKHATWVATFALVAALIPAHCLLDRLHAAPPASAEILSSGIMPSAGLAAVPLPEMESPGPVGSLRSDGANVDEMGAPVSSNALPEDSCPADISVAENQMGVSAHIDSKEATVAVSEHPRARLENAAKSPWLLARLLEPALWTFAPGLGRPQIAGVVLLVAWLGIAGIKTGILLWHVRELRRLKAGAAPPGALLTELFRRLRHELGVRRQVQLKVCPVHRSPVLVGFLHPVILLPAEQLPDASEAEVILRHELAHARRGDDWANLVQHFIQAILFFHPAVWWISRQLCIQREIACDDCILHQGGRPRAYALLLADLASRLNTRRPLLAPGVTNSKSQLQQRIDMILNPNRDTSPRLAKSRLGFITSAAALVTALAVYAAPRLVLAEPPSPPPPVAQPPSPPDAPALAEAPVNSEPSATPLAIEPGAKAKSGDSIDGAPASISIAPVAPTPPAIVARPHAVNRPSVPYVAMTPGPPLYVASADAEASIEQRLRRLEKMVESLVEQRQAKEFDWSLRKQGPRVETRIETETKQLRETAKRQAERAAEQSRNAVKEVEKAMKLQQDRHAHDMAKEGKARQLEALHKQRQALERHMQDVQRQIDRLEQEQNKLQDQKEQNSQILEELSADIDDLAQLEEPLAEGDAVNPTLPRK